MRIHKSEFMRTRNILLVALCLLPIALGAAKKPENWVTGVLVEYEEIPETVDDEIFKTTRDIMMHRFWVVLPDGYTRVYEHVYMGMFTNPNRPSCEINAPIRIRFAKHVVRYDIGMEHDRVTIQDQSKPNERFNALLIRVVRPKAGPRVK